MIIVRYVEPQHLACFRCRTVFLDPGRQLFHACPAPQPAGMTLDDYLDALRRLGGGLARERDN